MIAIEQIENTLKSKCFNGYKILKKGEIFRLNDILPLIYHLEQFNNHQEFIDFMESEKFYDHIKPNFVLCYYIEACCLGYAIKDQEAVVHYTNEKSVLQSLDLKLEDIL